MKHFLLKDYGNASQPYSFSRNVRKALKEARKTISDCIGALPEEIYFTSGGTESDNWAIKGLMAGKDKRITITSQIEHHAVINACNTLRRLGYPVSFLLVDKEGVILPETLEKPINEDVNLISIMMANNEIGTIEAIHELSEIAHELGVDMLSESGHKFNAPKGIGFLYIKNGVKICPYADGGAQEAELRAGTENIASIVAMAVALKMNCDNMSSTRNKMVRMENAFIQALDDAGINYIRNGSDEYIPCNINISIKGADGEILLHRLDLKGICISTGSACDSTNTQISHVIKEISVPKEYAEGTIRISFGRMNEEMDAIIVAQNLIDILKSVV